MPLELSEKLGQPGGDEKDQIQRQGRALPPADGHDLLWGEASPEAQADAIAQHLALKGFCVIGEVSSPETLARAEKEIQKFGGDFYALNPMVMDGLLGAGSQRVADLDSPEKEDRRGGATLLELDDTFSYLGDLLEPHFHTIGVNCSHRSVAMLHEGDRPKDELPAPLTEKIAHTWTGIFLRHRLMVITFLGPASGSLELTPCSTERTMPYKIRVRPGVMVVLRPDLMQHIYEPRGKAYAMSCFFCYGGRLTPVVSPIPAVLYLEDWVSKRLETLRQEQEDDLFWDPQVPSEYRYAMNRLYHKGQHISVRGCATMLPGFTDPETWVSACHAGPDHIIKVPLERWDHTDYFDPDPESWRREKTYCRHGGFMEGIELFDARMFNVAPVEASVMDPNQRLVLDVGYSALHKAGYTKRSLLNANGGVYVAAGCCEWLYADRPNGGTMEATGSALAICAGRFSFTLGLKGPCFSIDTEASSGLTAVYHACDACQRKGLAPQADFGIALSSHLLLSPTWWPSQCASGWLSEKGRCLTFDASACGYVRADGVTSLVVSHSTDMIDGSAVRRDIDELGAIAGTCLNSNGGGASLSAPSGPAEQEAIADALRSAAIAPWDVDCVAGHSAGAFLADAIEVSSLLRAHRSDLHEEPLIFAAMKTNMGNQVETSGMASLIRAIFASRSGFAPPNLHLRQANQHLDILGQPSLMLDSSVEFKTPTNFTGVMSRGFGGSNVYVVALSERYTAGTAEAKPSRANAVSFWPGGGGSLRPIAQRYSIIGSWSNWGSADDMTRDAEGAWGFTITMGTSCVERFQILVDGQADKVLHPGHADMHRPSAAKGPAKVGREASWLITGCASVIVDPPLVPDSLSKAVCTSHGATILSLDAADAGMPGDQYRVRLHTAGQWQAVSWEKVKPPMSPERSIAQGTAGRFAVSASWNDWGLEAMQPVRESASLYHLVVMLPCGGGEFRIIKDEDLQQSLYPAVGAPNGRGCAAFGGEAVGPGKNPHGACWALGGKTGSIFRIELRLGDGSIKVAWRQEQRADAMFCPGVA